MAWCRIELFGGLRVRIGGRLVTRFRTRKTASLLAYLAYRLDRLHFREELAEMFWGESEPERARNSLSKAISSLRLQLMSWEDPAASVIYADRFYVGLRSEHVTTDVSEFESHLKAARNSRSDAERVNHLAAAVELYRGELLPDFYDDWIEPERQRWAERFEAAAHELVSLHERMGDREQALYYARLAVAAAPLSEAACERVMRILLALNRPVEALREFNAFRQRLSEKFGQNFSAFSPHFSALVSEANRRATSQLASLPVRQPDASHPITPSLVGTLTILAVHCRPRNGDRQRLKRALQDLVSRHGGQLFRFAGETLFACFPCVRWALECAFSCRLCLEGHPVRCFVDTVDLESESKLPTVLKQMGDVLSNVAADGQVFCSESSALLVRGDAKVASRLKKVGFEGLFRLEVSEKVGAPAEGFLPPLTNPLFGRSEELSQLHRLIVGEGERLVTLVGLGGCGKTRLALEFGHRALSHFGNAVWFIPLSPADKPDKLVELLGQRLGLSASLGEGKSIWELVAGELAGRKCLLIWDGFEHLLPEGKSALQRLLEHFPSAQFLVTSQRPIGLASERLIPVAPLPTPPCPTSEGSIRETNLEELKANPSVQMFVDRARAVLPDFQLTERTAFKVAQICARLEGIPLSIELAAAWLDRMTLDQVLTRLERGLSALKASRRSIPAHHQSLQVVLEGTWQMFPEEWQRLLACLCVFSNGATDRSIRAVADLHDPESALVELKRLGVVRAFEHSGELRWDLLDTVREFVAGAMGEESLQSFRRRHADHFLALAEQFSQSAGRTAEGWAHWLQRLERERGNLRAALNWATKNEPSKAIALLKALKVFWRVQGTLSEAREWSRKILAKVAKEPADVRSEAYLLACWCALAVGDSKIAQKLLERAVALCGPFGPQHCQAEALGALAQLHFRLGNYDLARHWAEKCLACWQSTGDLRGEGEVEFLLGSIAFRQNRLNLSRRHYSRSLKCFEAVGDQMGTAMALAGLAEIAWRQGKFDRAHAFYERVVDFWSVVNPAKGFGFIPDLGLTALYTGNYRQARQHYQTALAVCKAIGNQAGVGASLNGLASVAWRKGELKQAQRLFNKALRVFQSIGNKWGIALTLTDLGNVALLRGDERNASELLAQSLSLWQQLGDQWGLARAHFKLGVLAARKRRHREALEHFKESLKLCLRVGDRVGLAEVFEGLADWAYRLGAFPFAVRLLAKAADLRLRLKAPVPPVQKPSLENLEGKLKDALTADQFDAHWRQGQKMTVRHLTQQLSTLTETLKLTSSSPARRKLSAPASFETNIP